MKKLLQLLGALVCAFLFVQLAIAQAPTFLPAGGAYTGTQSVTITCGSGQTAAYTLDGSQPNIASTKYTSPVSISATATLKAICANIQVDYQNTQTSSTGYKCNTPNNATYGSLTCQASGGVGTIQPSNVALTWGATMVYSVSTTASSSETQVLIPYFGTGCDSCTYMAQDFYLKAVGDSSIIANNEVDMVDYNNTYGVNHQIGLQCNQQPGKIGWQIDSDGGTGWVNTGVTEGCPISTTTYTHVALEAHWTNGDTSGPHGKGYTYYDALTINGHRYSLVPMGGQPNSATTFGPKIGNQGQIDLTNTVKSGNNPTTGGRQVQLNNVAASIGAPSAVTSASYSISASGTAAATPSITPGGGFYSTTQTVTLADTTLGAAIHYTTDGTTPTCSSTTYSAPLSITTTTTLKAIACATGFNNSAVASAVYTFSGSGGLTATPTFSPGGGSYTTTQYVTLADTTSGAVIYFTTDGTTPTTASNVYSVPLAVSATATIKAMAAAPGYTNSSVASATYTITSTLIAATPTFSPTPGIFTATQTVTIADTTPAAVIHYTIDGSTPTCSSTTYSTPLSVASTTTVKAIACASGYSNSAVGAGIYTIACGATPLGTGNIDPTQIKPSSRKGAGPLVQMAVGGFTTGHGVAYDCNGDLVDSGGSPGGVTLETNGTPNGSQGTLNLKAGTNVTLANSGGDVTINASGGGGATFPLNIPGIYIWCAADQLTGFSDGNSVASWPNLAGGPALSAVGTSPIYKTGILNSLPIIRFGGAGSYQGLMPDIVGAREASIFLVLKISSLTNAYSGILTSTTSGQFQYFIKSNGKSAMFIGSGNYDGSGAATFSTANFYIVSILLGPTGLTTRVALATDFTSTSTGFNSLTTGVGATLGNDSVNAGRFFTGDIAEVIAIRRAVTSTELSTIENALKTKYGL